MNDTAYCMRCKMPQLVDNLEEVETKTGKIRIKGNCVVCGTKVSKFKKQTGGSVLNDTLNADILPELHLIGIPEGKYSFCGPGTKLHKRLNPDDTPKDFSKPVNRLDQGCYAHDLAYRDYKNVPQRNVADRELITVTDEVLQNPQSSLNQKFNAKFVKSIMGTKTKFEL